MADGAASPVTVAGAAADLREIPRRVPFSLLAKNRHIQSYAETMRAVKRARVERSGSLRSACDPPRTSMVRRDDRNSGVRRSSPLASGELRHLLSFTVLQSSSGECWRNTSCFVRVFDEGIQIFGGEPRRRRARGARRPGVSACAVWEPRGADDRCYERRLWRYRHVDTLCDRPDFFRS